MANFTALSKNKCKKSLLCKIIMAVEIVLSLMLVISFIVAIAIGLTVDKNDKKNTGETFTEAICYGDY